MILSDYLHNSFTKYKYKTAISYPERKEELTYGELQAKSENCAYSLLHLGILSQHKIALVAPSSPEWVEVFLGAIQVGIIPVCLNDNSTAKELTFMLNHSDSEIIFTTYEIFSHNIDLSILPNIKKVIILDNKKDTETNTIINFSTFLNQHERIDEMAFINRIANVKDNDIITIQYTSGTTGNPKAIQLVQHNVLMNLVATQKEAFQYTENEIILNALPLYHVMGCFISLLLGLAVGSKVVLVSKFKTQKVLQYLQDEKCTAFHGVPTMYKFMLSTFDNYNIMNLKYGFIAGDYCSPTTFEEIQNVIKFEHMFPVYGQTEGMIFTAINRQDSFEKVKNTVGKPLSSMEINIVDSDNNPLPQGKVGEIIFKTPYQMLAYYKNEEATNKTLQDGWLHTGDLGCLDEDDYLIFKGRKKDIIIRGGENISPTEIEEALKDYKRVKDACVVGIPDPMMGEEVAAFIIVDENSLNLDSETLEGKIRRYMLKNLARHKCPKYIRFVDSYPMTSSGKIQKFKLIEKGI